MPRLISPYGSASPISIWELPLPQPRIQSATLLVTPCLTLPLTLPNSPMTQHTANIPTCNTVTSSQLTFCSSALSSSISTTNFIADINAREAIAEKIYNHYIAPIVVSSLPPPNTLADTNTFSRRHSHRSAKMSTSLIYALSRFLLA